MSDSIIFYFDYSSSYSYIAQARISEIEKSGKSVLWQPILLGAVFQHFGHSIPPADSIKMNYLTHDLKRCAQRLNIPYQTPPVFPFNGIEAMRIFYALDANDQDLARRFTEKVFAAAYGDHIDMGQPDNVAEVLNTMGLDRDRIVNADNFSNAKKALKNATRQAIDANVFGAPTFVYNDELFWGADRIDTLIAAAT